MTLKSYSDAATDFASVSKAVTKARKVIKNTRELAAQHGNSPEMLETVRPLEELLGYYEVDPGSVSVEEIRTALAEVGAA